MIRYALACAAGHGFESWFGDSEAFEAQRARGLVECPFCGSKSVEKQIMTPALARADDDPVGADSRAAQIRARVRALRAEIEEKTEDVGRRFPDEARRIHHGDAPERAIRGQASPREALELLEEGVPVLPVPALPDDGN
ncbi:MAG: DUF1178 family protein [Rhodoblastus sp.]|nr:MAG: DUF1178 family protein [Rhodoblastus sp.]